MVEEIICEPEKEVIDLTDTSERIPINKCVEDIFNVFSQAPVEVEKIVYLRLQAKYGTGVWK